MILERITDTAHPMYRQAMELYQASFPEHEQREALSQETILRDSEYHFCLLYDEDVFVGLVLYWEQETFLYIEHFCILPQMRNKRYGQKALALLMEQHKTLLLEIDPPVDPISCRRKGFYERCGFRENPFRHIHPPYHRGNAGHELAVMTCPEPLTRDAYDIFSQYLKNRVMKDAWN